MNNEYIEPQDFTSDLELEKKIRQKISEWSNSVEYHDHTNLGEKIKVNKIVFAPTYTCRIATQTETRRVASCEESYRGGAIPSLIYKSAAAVNPWKTEFNFSTINSLTERRDFLTVNGSQEVSTCSSCHGKGTIECIYCNGKGTERCYTCGGSGRVRCGSCNGRGWHYKSDGSGNTYSCGNCGASGQVTCSRCNGRGEVRCSRCNGRGKETCRTCSGTGKMLSYLQIERNLDIQKTDECLMSPRILKEIPEYRENCLSYPSKRLYYKKAPLLSADDFPQNRIHNDVAKTILFSQRVSANILFQEISVERIDTWEVDYHYQGKNYFLVLYGNEKNVVANLSPVSEAAGERWKEAHNSWRKYLYFNAWLEMVLTKNMNQYDLKENVDECMEIIDNKLLQYEKRGSLFGTILASLFLAFMLPIYYDKVNYVFAYADFLNNPSNFFYVYHTWSMTLFSILLCLLCAPSCTRWFTEKFFPIPTHLLRYIVPALIAIVFCGITATLVALLNCTGITLLVTIAGIILTYLFKVVVVIIYLIVSIVKWIVGLF